MKLLLEYRVDSNIQDFENEQSLLCYSYMTKKWQALEMLLDYPYVDVNIENESDKGTLYGAMQQMLYNEFWCVRKKYQPKRFLKMLFEKHATDVDRYKA